MRSNIDVLTPEAAYSVVDRMRDVDRREIFAVRWSENIDDLVADCMASRPTAWSASSHGVPVCVFGIARVRPNVCAGWLFATDDFTEVGLEVTRFAKRHIVPSLRSEGVHRIECHSADFHTGAHRWLEAAFDAKREAAHPGFGSRGETFHTYAWVDSDVLSKDTRG